ncbi:hypothetical protein PHJA_000854300 [Phtheirospermum japonicum]|uniref:Uncharacterized protein n=1 Tax=Phtheirospermum japonicum TaxID=374723 RepID=A0A830BU08_9LAMI|nr:hypothetical protein PHJA_000854300 [Phtheirospermum japonicum]
MNLSSILCTLLGASATLFLILPEIEKTRKRKVAIDKLKIISVALQQAEERAARYEQRHDRILSQICCYYMINQNLEEALAGARDAMNEALQFAVGLRNMQMEIINSFS